MPVKNKTTLWDLKEFFEEEFFETKKVVYVRGDKSKYIIWKNKEI